MKNEIAQCFCDTDDKAGAAKIRFPAEFVGFRGHFENNPVLPGVCLVLAGQVLAERMLSQELRLQLLQRAKFLQPVMPDQELEITCSLTDAHAKVAIRRNDSRVAELVMTFRPAAEADAP